MADNFKWFKVWTSITDDPDFLEMNLDDIGRWVLLGAYIRKHGVNGQLTVSDRVLSSLLRCQENEIDVTIAHLHNTVKDIKDCNGKNIVTFKNWHKYQIDDSSQRVAKYRQNVTMQDKIRRDKIRRDKIKKIYIPPLDENLKSTGNEKIKYADYVSLTPLQYDKLVSEHGEAKTKRMIEILDNYKGSHGKRYKCDYRAILSWVVGKLAEQEKAGQKLSPAELMLKELESNGQKNLS